MRTRTNTSLGGAIEPAASADGSLAQHFSKLAHRYDALRITDALPVEMVVTALEQRPTVVAADVGCGTGRYAISLMRAMGNRLSLHLVECNLRMIAQLRANLAREGVRGCPIHRARAEELPAALKGADCLLAFNAVHHFDLSLFLREAVKTLRPGGLLFIYTRFRDQNRRGIWGQFFPGFADREDRLYEEAAMRTAIDDTPGLTLCETSALAFQRSATLEILADRARSKHYSTFSYYTAAELEAAVELFQERLTRQFGSGGAVEWVDENTMLMIEAS